ncbi:helix-turn-helix domain-containing protein [Marispirochaeta sp.]|uniref:helix-turn-helix transcriptional regulator n=1 Tax=Marispirochaeta sp. TaxID=2038653 RepID=UPI0029C67592|nr:helix-turn-helix domain-containing protein [Marispirochaeta sp.]
MALLTYKTVRGTLPLAEQTIRTMVSRGQLPHYKLGSRVFFDREEIEEWIKSRHIPAEGRR